MGRRGQGAIEVGVEVVSPTHVHSFMHAAYTPPPRQVHMCSKVKSHTCGLVTKPSSSFEANSILFEANDTGHLIDSGLEAHALPWACVLLPSTPKVFSFFFVEELGLVGAGVVPAHLANKIFRISMFAYIL